MTEKELVRKIRSYSFIETIKNELQRQIDSLVYRTTSANSPENPAQTNTVSSKVETYVLDRLDLERKRDARQRELNEIWGLIHNSGLDAEEVEVLWCISQRESLAAYARSKRMYRSRVYKVRDRALKKVCAMLQNEGKNG